MSILHVHVEQKDVLNHVNLAALCMARARLIVTLHNGALISQHLVPRRDLTIFIGFVAAILYSCLFTTANTTIPITTEILA